MRRSVLSSLLAVGASNLVRTIQPALRTAFVAMRIA